MKASRLPGIRRFFFSIGIIILLAGFAVGITTGQATGIFAFTALILLFYGGCSFIVWRIIRGRALSTVERELAEARKELHAHKADLPLSKEVFETGNAALENGDPVRAEILAQVVYELPETEAPIRRLLSRSREEDSTASTLPTDYRRGLETAIDRLTDYISDDPGEILPQLERIRDNLAEQQLAVSEDIRERVGTVASRSDPETRAELWNDIADRTGLIAAFVEVGLFPPSSEYPRQGSVYGYANEAVPASGYHTSETQFGPQTVDRLVSAVDRAIDSDRHEDRFRYASVYSRIEALRAEIDRAEAMLENDQGFESQERFRKVTRDLESVQEMASENSFSDLVDMCEELLARGREGQRRAYQTVGGKGQPTASGNDPDSTVSVDRQQSTARTPNQGVSEPLQTELPDHEVLEHIGSGGNADVHKVRLENSGDVVALKIPQWQSTLSRTAAEAFVDEARTWTQLDDHEHIISVRNFGVDPYPWMLLEFMDRGNLAAHIESLSIRQGLQILIDVCDATHYAHQHGVAHTDIKPENIMFTTTDDEITVKIGDWGLAQVMLEHSKSVEGMTPSYASPEQIDPDTFGSTGPRTDIYQLGVITYEILTKQVPYDYDSMAATMNAVVSKDLTPPSAHDDRLAPAIDEAVLTAMATDKEDRYETVLYFRDALRELLS